MSENEILIVSNGILFKISVITGWSIPNDKTYQDALVAEINFKCIEDYYDLTIEEVMYAMRNYSKHVEDYGKALNLQLIDKVIDLYRKDRMRVSLLEQSKLKEEQRIFSEAELENSERENVEICYQRFLKAIPLNYPAALAPIMIKDGLIKDESTVVEYFKHHAASGSKNLYYVTQEKPMDSNG